MMMRKKLPRRSQRRGLTSFQTSGITFFSFGLGRFAERSAEVALPILREGRSAAFMPPPNLDGPKEEDISLPILRRAERFPLLLMNLTRSEAIPCGVAGVLMLLQRPRCRMWA